MERMEGSEEETVTVYTVVFGREPDCVPYPFSSLMSSHLVGCVTGSALNLRFPTQRATRPVNEMTEIHQFTDPSPFTP